MKATGIVRNVDSLGRIVIPSEIREKFGVKEGNSAFEIFVEDDKVVLRKYEPTCIFCGNTDGIKVFKGRNVCRKCAKELNK